VAGGASSSEFMVKALRPLEVCRLSRFNGRTDDSPMLSAAGWVSGSAVAPAASAPAAPGVSDACNRAAVLSRRLYGDTLQGTAGQGRSGQRAGQVSTACRHVMHCTHGMHCRHSMHCRHGGTAGTAGVARRERAGQGRAGRAGRAGTSLCTVGVCHFLCRPRSLPRPQEEDEDEEHQE
jgi:hypothetical protein